MTRQPTFSSPRLASISRRPATTPAQTRSHSTNSGSNQHSHTIDANQISARQQQISQLANSRIQQHLDMLTKGTWTASYESSVYDVSSKGGLWDYDMPARDISIKFTRRGSSDSTFVADRIIKYQNKDYPEKFVGSVSPDGRVIMNSIKDSDILSGQIDRKSGTLSLLFVDDGLAVSSLGSQTAVGSVVFNDISKPYASLPSW